MQPHTHNSIVNNGPVEKRLGPPKSSDMSSLNGESGCSPRHWSYILEWILMIIVIVVPLALIVYLIPFRNRSISLLDATIQQPYFVNDTMPIIGVFIPSALVPLIFFALYPLLLSRYASRAGLPTHVHSLRYFYWWTACLIQTIGLTVLLSELSKRLVQAPRPDFLHRCFPNGIPNDLRDAAVKNNYIIDTSLCQYDSRSIYEDGLQSVPSEHTSLAFCMMTILVLFFMTVRRELITASLANRALMRREKERVPLLQRHPTTTTTSTGDSTASNAVPCALARQHEIDKGASVHGPLLIEYGSSFTSTPQSTALQPDAPKRAHSAFWPVSDAAAIAHVILPYGWAVLVGFSRTFDHRHSFHDVLCGGVLGIAVAFAVCWMHRSHFESYHQRWYENQVDQCLMGDHHERAARSEEILLQHAHQAQSHQDDDIEQQRGAVQQQHELKHLAQPAPIPPTDPAIVAASAPTSGSVTPTDTGTASNSINGATQPDI